MTSSRAGAAAARWFEAHAVPIAALSILLVTILLRWQGHVHAHEAMYFVGPHRVVDPELLARDLSWGRFSPTTFLFDHLLAPLWNPLGDLWIATLGRLLFWGLTGWSLVLVTRAMRVPAWAAVAGYTAWLVFKQTLFTCGQPINGFQPKSLSYPLFYFSLAFAMRGQVIRAGLAAGLATVFHIIVGGWGCLAVFVSMVVSRRYTRRQLGQFLLATAPLVGPLVIAVGLFNAGGSAQDQAAMDRIYVTFAAPHCCDMRSFFDSGARSSTFVVFLFAPLLLYLWRARGEERLPAHFVTVLIAIFLLGALGQELHAWWFLKLFPFQLAAALPALFLFIIVLALAAERPRHLAGKAAWVAGIAACAGLFTGSKIDGVWEDLVDAPERLTLRDEHPGRALHYADREAPLELYQWIRASTPRDAVFVTPHLGEFWVLAERAQVASVRHPPIDKAIIEWEQRLIALNRGQPFRNAGFDIEPELNANQGRLSLVELVQMRERYGATHYLTRHHRIDLAPFLLHSADGYGVYGLAGMQLAEITPSPAAPGRP